MIFYSSLARYTIAVYCTFINREQALYIEHLLWVFQSKSGWKTAAGHTYPPAPKGAMLLLVIESVKHGIRNSLCCCRYNVRCHLSELFIEVFSSHVHISVSIFSRST